jgi:hypothetical protein
MKILVLGLALSTLLNSYGIAHALNSEAVCQSQEIAAPPDWADKCFHTKRAATIIMTYRQNHVDPSNLLQWVINQKAETSKHYMEMLAEAYQRDIQVSAFEEAKVIRDFAFKHYLACWQRAVE